MMQMDIITVLMGNYTVVYYRSPWQLFGCWCCYWWSRWSYLIL